MAGRSNGTRRRVHAPVPNMTAAEELKALAVEVAEVAEHGQARSAGTELQHKANTALFTRWVHETFDVNVTDLVPIPGELLLLWAYQQLKKGIRSKKGIKPETARAYVRGAVNGLTGAGHEVSDVAETKTAVANLAAQTAKSMTMGDERAVTRQARPFVKEELAKLLAKLAEWRANPGGLADRWLLRFAASLRFGYTFALRISELLEARWGWLKVIHIGDDVVQVTLTIPKSKYQPEPETIRTLVSADEWALVEEWRRSQEAVGAPVGPDDRILLETSRYRTLPYRKTYSERLKVKGRKLSEFEEVVAELDEPDVKPSTIAAGSVKKLHWKCSICGYRFEAQVNGQTNRHAGCRCCADRKRYFEGPSVPPSPAAGHEWIDLLDRYVNDVAAHPDLTAAQRRVRAVGNEAGAYRKALKQLCTAAGVEPHNNLEYIGSHGARRGRATDGIRAGATQTQVAAYLRHDGLDTVRRYISEADSPLSPALHSLDAFVDAPDTDEPAA